MARSRSGRFARRLLGMGHQSPFRQYSRRFRHIKLPSGRTLGILVAVALVGGLVYWFASRQTLEGRARAIAEAVPNCDIKTVAEMSVPDAEMNAMLWTNDVYKSYCDVQMALGGMKPGMKIQVTPSDSGSDAQALVSYSREGAQGSMPGVTPPPPAGKSGSAPKDSLDLVLYWSRDSFGNWMFDAKKTRETAKPAK